MSAEHGCKDVAAEVLLSNSLIIYTLPRSSSSSLNADLSLSLALYMGQSEKRV